MSDLASVLRDLHRCSSLINKPWAIEVDNEDDSLCYNGVIIGDSQSPIWGNAVRFTFSIDKDNLSSPPKVAFPPGVDHPFIDPIYGQFCFPSSDSSLSSRMNMEEFLDQFVRIFLLEYPFSYAINMNAAKSFWANPTMFWSVFRQQIFDTQHAA